MVLVVALLALVALRKASTEAIPESALRPSHASTSIHKRHLRESAYVETSGNTNNGGDRRLAISLPGLEGFTARITSLKRSMAKIWSYLQVRWWRWRQKTPDYVFKYLKLDMIEGDLFQSAQFLTWHEFIKKTNPDDVIGVMFTTMLEQFGSDAVLAEVLLRGQVSFETEDTATLLLTRLVAKWIDDKKPDEKVFDLLQLDKIEGDLFQSPYFLTWHELVKKTNPDNELGMMLHVMLKRFKGDLNVVDVLLRGTGSVVTEGTAKLLFTRLVAKWIDEKKSAEEVFDFLQLNKIEGDLFQDPQFITWHEFVKRTDPDNELSMMLHVMLKRFKGDLNVVDVLRRGTGSFVMEGTAKLLFTRLVAKWIDDKKPAEEVFDLLQLDKIEGDLFQDPQFITWHEFVKKTNHPEDVIGVMYETMLLRFRTDRKVVDVLLRGIGHSELADLLCIHQVKAWIKLKHELEDVFRLLQLDALDANQLFDSPIINMWALFITLNKFSYDEPFNFLKEKYGVRDLLKAIAVEHTADEYHLANHMRQFQLQWWQWDDVDVADLFNILVLKDDARFFENPLLSIWFDYVRMLLKDRAPDLHEAKYHVMVFEIFVHMAGTVKAAEVLDGAAKEGPLTKWVERFKALLQDDDVTPEEPKTLSG